MKWIKVINAKNKVKINIDLNDIKFCSSFEYDAKMLAHELAYSGMADHFINNTIKKISAKVFDIFETNDTYGVLLVNNYVTEEIESYDKIFRTHPNSPYMLRKDIEEMGENIPEYNKNMEILINNFQQIKNDKIVKKLETFKSTINQFYQTLRNDRKETKYMVGLYNNEGDVDTSTDW